MSTGVPYARLVLPAKMLRVLAALALAASGALAFAAAFAFAPGAFALWAAAVRTPVAKSEEGLCRGLIAVDG